MKKSLYFLLLTLSLSAEGQKPFWKDFNFIGSFQMGPDTSCICFTLKADSTFIRTAYDMGKPAAPDSGTWRIEGANVVMLPYKKEPYLYEYILMIKRNRITGRVKLKTKSLIQLFGFHIPFWGSTYRRKES